MLRSRALAALSWSFWSKSNTSVKDYLPQHRSIERGSALSSLIKAFMSMGCCIDTSSERLRLHLLTAFVTRFCGTRTGEVRSMITGAGVGVRKRALRRTPSGLRGAILETKMHRTQQTGRKGQQAEPVGKQTWRNVKEPHEDETFERMRSTCYIIVLETP